MEQVPIVDLTPAQAAEPVGRRNVARLIDEACVAIGFFAVTGHGVPEAVSRDLREAAHAFFALPPAAKPKEAIVWAETEIRRIVDQK